MTAVLVVEDSHDIAALVQETLTAEGHHVTVAHDGLEARQATRQDGPAFDCIVLDLMLPYVNGSEILRALRTHSHTPVLVLSAKDAVWSKVDLLRLGADDYMVKPFDLTELCARVDALLRRGQPSTGSPVLRHGPLVLDTGSALVTVNDAPVDLTATEYRILRLFLRAPARVLSKAQIYEDVWEEPFMGDDGAVKTHVSNLRAKLAAACAQTLTPGSDAPEQIQTVWGLGYRLAKLDS